jgi:class 3 adenylate cyclase/DNA-binding NarL/FixJ family response regulator
VAMEFFELLDEVAAVLRQRGRVSYRALTRQFDLDDALVEDLKLELIEAQGVAADEAGMFLVAREKLADAAPPAAEAGASSPARPEPGAAPRSTEEGPGASLPTATTEPAGGEAIPDGWGAQEAERRQLSVLFCDLVGSSALAAVLDPEDLRKVLDEYQRLCAGVIERHGGVIARQVGDGLLVNFGYPHAHEDDARRAARAGLAIVAGLPKLNARLARRFAALRTQPLQVRIGLHTGPVVVGALGDSTYRDPMAVVGETPNIAARLQGLAEPDALVVSGATRRLLGATFLCDNLGLHTLMGIAAPIAVHRVRAEREDIEPGEAAIGIGRLTPLVGREQEIAVLIGRWERSKDGLGQVVLLTGEAGIGKSRLVQELKAHVAREAHIRLQGRASPYHQQSAFYPFIDLLQRPVHFERADSAETKRDKLAAALRQYQLPVDDLLPWLASLLSLPAEPSAPAPGDLTPQQQRQRTLQALLALVLQPAAREPLLLILEDLHWADPSTLEVLETLLMQAATARILIVLTARQDFHVSWSTSAHLTLLTLTRLRRTQVERVMAAVSGGRVLPPAIVEEVARKTDGVPLFLGEVTKMVLESDLLCEGASGYELAGPLPPLAIPTTLQDSLMARLDRLAATKLVAQLGATIGRSFSYELLRAVAGLDEETLTAELRKLVEAELVYQRGFPPGATYTFKHALI